MYQYILFDLDGTLTDSREGITKSVQYALDKMGIHEPELKPLERFIGPPLYDEFRRSYGFDDAQAKQAIAFYRERFGVVGWKENMLYNGIPELLKALTDAGKTLSTASSKPAFFIDKIVKYFNIDQYFTVVSGATLDGTIGTKTQVTQQALDRLRVQDLSQAVLVGDRLHDVEGAKQCGIDCIGVTFGFGDREELEDAGAKHVVDRVEELLPLLMKDKLLAKGVSHLLSSQLTRILRTHAAMSVLGHGLLRGAGLGGPVGAALNGVKAVSGSAYRVTIPAVLQIACLRRMVSATQV